MVFASAVIRKMLCKYTVCTLLSHSNTDTALIRRNICNYGEFGRFVESYSKCLYRLCVHRFVRVRELFRDESLSGFQDDANADL